MLAISTCLMITALRFKDTDEALSIQNLFALFSTFWINLTTLQDSWDCNASKGGMISQKLIINQAERWRIRYWPDICVCVGGGGWNISRTLVRIVGVPPENQTWNALNESTAYSKYSGLKYCFFLVYVFLVLAVLYVVKYILLIVHIHYIFRPNWPCLAICTV
jgi:hypothetical protein